MSNDETGSDGGEDGEVHRCDFCRLPIPHDPLEATVDGETYEFCSSACQESMADSDRVFTRYHGFRRFDPGVAALRAGLPEGIPRNSFVLLRGLPGSRTDALEAELVWRALQRGEPVVFLSFLEPPVSVLQSFVSLEWNVLPYLENDQLRIVDGFTYRVDDRERMYDRMNAWNTHLRNVASGATLTVRDPSEARELRNRLDDAMESLGMADEGIVVIDSLTEFGSLVQPLQAYHFLKDVRADICKGRFVPVFAGATVTGNGEGFPHDLEYMVDGIVEMRLDEETIEDALIKQIRVRKMDGVLTYPEWSAYEFTSGKGIVMFDPVAEQADDEAPAEAADATEGSPADEATEDGGDADTDG